MRGFKYMRGFDVDYEMLSFVISVIGMAICLAMATIQ